MDRRQLGEILGRWRPRLIDHCRRQREERAIGGLAGFAHEVEPEPGALAIVLDQAAIDGDLRPELRAVVGASESASRQAAACVAQQQIDLGRPACQHQIRSQWRQAFDQRPGVVQIAHGDQPLDAQGQQVAGLAAADRRAGSRAGVARAGAAAVTA